MSRPNQASYGTFDIIAGKDISESYPVYFREPDGPQTGGQWKGKLTQEDTPRVGTPDTILPVNEWKPDPKKVTQPLPAPDWEADSEDAPAPNVIKAHFVDLEKAGNGVMIALLLPREIAEALAVPGGENPADMHVTVAYLGREISDADAATVERVVRRVARRWQPIEGRVGGIGMFNATESSDWKNVVYASFDAPTLGSFRAELMEALDANGTPGYTNHGYSPHITLAYIDPATTPLKTPPDFKMVFESITLKVGRRQIDVPLRGKVKKAIGTKDRSEKAKPAPKPSKSGKRTVDEKGRKRYDYKSGKAGAHQGEGREQAPARHKGEGYAETLAHITKQHPDTVKKLARKFGSSDKFTQHFMTRYGKLARKHGIGHHHLHHIHDAAKAEAAHIHLDLQKADKLLGGRADGMEPGQFDPKQLKLGMKHELEHTNDSQLAREIAMDHLDEDPDYYKKLRRL